MSKKLTPVVVFIVVTISILFGALAVISLAVGTPVVTGLLAIAAAATAWAAFGFPGTRHHSA